MNSSAGTLDHAISNHPFRPKEVKVGIELWKALKQAGRITWKRGSFEGVMDSEFDAPVLDESIFVHVDPELKDWGYIVPQGP